MKSILKILFVSISIVILITAAAAVFYFYILPFAVSNAKVINYAEKTVKKYAQVDFEITNPKLVTKNIPYIEFSAGNMYAGKSDEKLIDIQNLDAQISLKKIFEKTIIINRFGADNLFLDADKLMQIIPSQNENNQPQACDWKIDLFDSVLYLNSSKILYTPLKGTLIDLSADNLSIDNTQKEERFVRFDLNIDITKNNKTVNIAIKDDNKVVIKNKKLYVENCPLIINHSKMFFDAWADGNNDFEVNVFAKRFFIPDVIKLLLTDVVENNIRDVLELVKDIKGDFDFNIKLTKDDISGDIILNKLDAKLFPLNNLPFLVNSGKITIKGNNLTLNGFKGYYNNKKSNEFELDGRVNDYLNTLDTHIDMLTVLSNDFFKDYLSKVAGVSLTLIGKSKAKIVIESINNNFDVVMAGKIAKGDDILIEGASISPTGYDRALKAVLHIIGDKVNIETINYYIAKELTKESKGQVKPIITINGNMNITDGQIYDLGFEVPNPLPSEFLNVLIGQKMFRKGTFSGNMHYINTGKVPVLEGDLDAEGILIPSQRLFLKKGEIKTVDNIINITAEGKYRKCIYNFTGKILNEMVFPVVIKDIMLTVDDVDVERLMKAFTAPVEAADYTKEEIDEDDTNDALAFDIGNLIIEKCVLNLVKGKYKEINFSNVIANMTLDKNSIFNLTSNLFEIAEGHSTAKVNCDLKNQKYYLRLGIKEVNSDIMSTAILNLKREITGKASGLIELNTDESLKLNGIIKFEVKDGSIQKIGLVEYVLKFAALFRNPLAMISPSVFSDMVNIPEGNFDKITGDLKLKDNVIELMRIKSSSPQLSSYIVGCYNLENSDAILRIYTKFSNKNKGFAGALRNISLNSLANRIPLKSKNDANYYAAELAQLPEIDAEEKDCQVFLTKVDGDVEHNNFISSLKKIK